jgi:hypothetical protein
MLDLEPRALEGDLLETLHLALKKNRHPPLAPPGLEGMALP